MKPLDRADMRRRIRAAIRALRIPHLESATSDYYRVLAGICLGRLNHCRLAWRVLEWVEPYAPEPEPDEFPF